MKVPETFSSPEISSLVKTAKIQIKPREHQNTFIKLRLDQTDVFLQLSRHGCIKGPRHQEHSV